MEKYGYTDLVNDAKALKTPLFVRIELCSTCNFNCRHCYVSSRTNLGLPQKKIFILLDELYSLGTFFVTFTGGEIFTRNDTLAILKKCRELKFSTIIYTNGYLLNEVMISKLSNLYLHEIHISIYGASSETHDYITQKKGSFDKTVENVKMMIDYGMRVRLKSPLMHHNYNEVEQLKNLANQLKCALHFSTVIGTKDDGDDSNHCLRLTRKQLCHVLKDPDVAPFSDIPIEFSMVEDEKPCDVVDIGASISPNGDVFLCNLLQIPGGNITVRSFENIWYNAREFERIRAIRNCDLEQCPTCKLFQYCNRCPGNAYIDTQNLLKCSPVAKKEALIRRKLGIYAISGVYGGHFAPLKNSTLTTEEP